MVPNMAPAVLLLGLAAAAAGTPAFAATLPFVNAYVIPHSHCDAGYVKTFSQYYEEEVRYILSSVVGELLGDVTKRFVWSETSFFSLWWSEQSEEVRAQVRALEASGQLEFIGGGWVMSDEAVAECEAVVDQLTLGHAWLQANLGVRPRHGWQIDPFGASSVTPLLYAGLGFEGTVYRRMPWALHLEFGAERALEMQWFGSVAGQPNTSLLTHLLCCTYSTPHGFNFDHPANTTVPITPENVAARSAVFAARVREQAALYRTGNVLVTMGGDFQYQNASVIFSNLSQIIDHINANQALFRMRVQYATLAEYFAALRAWESADPGHVFPAWQGDLLPYSETPGTDWTGFFTSRPALKAAIRFHHALLRASEQLFAVAAASGSLLPQQRQTLWPQVGLAREAQALVQHHDAVTGTSTQAVVDDYLSWLANGTQAAQGVAAAAVDAMWAAAAPACAALDLQFSVMDSAAAPSLAATLVAFNSLGWEVTSALAVVLANCSVGVWRAPAPLEPVQAQWSDDPDSGGCVLRFAATLPAAGWATFFLVPGATPWTAAPSCGAGTAISNAQLSVALDAASGLAAKAVVGDVALPLTHEFLSYVPWDDSAYFVRTQQPPVPYAPVQGAPATQVCTGPVFEEARTLFANGDSVAYRLFANASHGAVLELEMRLGPLPDDTELVSRFSPGLASAGAYYTDNIGVQMVRRTRLEIPVGHASWTSRNFFPAVSLGRLAGVPEGVADQSWRLSLAVAHTHGVASQADGQLEAMLHRRLSRSGWPDTGLGEPLNDTTVIDDRVWLWLAPCAIEGDDECDVAERHIAAELNNPPLVLLAAAPSGTSPQQIAAACAPALSGSALRAPLPDDALLFTLRAHDADAAQLELRVMPFLEDSTRAATPLQLDALLSSQLPSVNAAARASLDLCDTVPTAFNASLPPFTISSFLLSL